MNWNEIKDIHINKNIDEYLKKLKFDYGEFEQYQCSIQYFKDINKYEKGFLKIQEEDNIHTLLILINKNYIYLSRLEKYNKYYPWLNDEIKEITGLEKPIKSQRIKIEDKSIFDSIEKFDEFMENINF